MVCGRLAGNVALKTTEGLVITVSKLLNKSSRGHFLRSNLHIMAYPVLSAVKAAGSSPAQRRRPVGPRGLVFKATARPTGRPSARALNRAYDGSPQTTCWIGFVAARQRSAFSCCSLNCSPTINSTSAILMKRYSRITGTALFASPRRVTNADLVVHNQPPAA